MAPTKRAADTTAKAKAGDPRAMERLGTMYFRGEQGLPLDDAAAHDWWLKAAEKGNRDAMGNVAVSFRQRGDYERAARWFARQSNGEHDEAFYIAWMNKQFGKAKPAALPARIQKKIDAARSPAIKVTPRAAADAKLPVGASKIGGEPDLPAGTAWPAGLTFLAQIDLSDAAAHAPKGRLPSKGRLYFFHDTRAHRAGCVIHARAGAKLVRATSPLKAAGKYDIVSLSPAAIAFSPVETIPHRVSSLVAKWRLSDEENARYADGRPAGQHQMLGHADLIQDDLPKGVLLLQLDSDQTIRSNWDGTVYFVITEADLAAERFEKTKVVFQS
jgi:hypothetical protein